MKTKDTRQSKSLPSPKSERVRLFREYVLKHYTNVPIKGSDKEFHSSMELLYMMQGNLPGLTVWDITKVMNELEFETDNFGEFSEWIMYRIDGERLLEAEFGVSRDGD